ncbi:unnamed protein product [Discula destructiva]
MSFANFANTPEAMMKRNDSKNPSTTCRGVTGSGRPCRRPLSPRSSPQSSPQASPRKPQKSRGLQVPDPSDPHLYCWQHKDQATPSGQSSPGPKPSNTPIFEGRTSIESLTGRLGLLQASQSHAKPSRPQKPYGQPTHNLDSGLEPSSSSNANPRPSKKLKEFTFCCFRLPLYYDDPMPPSRPQAYPAQSSSASYPGKPNQHSSNNLKPPKNSKPARPSVGSQTPSSTSQTSEYLSLIPADASPDTAHKLLKELAKPLSKTDEAGYIYIFWLAPESEESSQTTAKARSVLEETERTLDRSIDPYNTRPGAERRPSDVLQSFADLADSIGTRSPTTMRSRALSSGDEKKTMLLKIGRANNVMRRMNEWKRQCGYHLSLIRFYPYVQTGSGVEPRKMPHAHKVERLIHLELSGMGMRVSDRQKEPCAACGTQHKEWFEVEATKEGVMRVDEAIRRWVDWDERSGSN